MRIRIEKGCKLRIIRGNEEGEQVEENDGKNRKKEWELGKKGEGESEDKNKVAEGEIK